MDTDANFEGFIPSNGHRLWNQSFYFNAYDPRSKLGCFVRLGFMEGLGLSNCWFIVFKDGKPLFQRINSHLPYTVKRIDTGVGLAGVRVTSLEPLRRARIEFTHGDFALDLTWTAMQPMMDSIALSADAEGSFERNIAHAHLEGSCRVRGTVRHRDSPNIDFNGHGARDVAAGPRDWTAMRHYRLAMPIFEDSLTIIGIHGIADGGKDSYMKMLHDGRSWQRIATLRDVLQFEDDDMTVRHADWDVTAENGTRYHVQGRRLFRCFLPLDSFMLAEHMMEFTRDDGAVGYGLVECGYRFPWSGNGT